MNKDKYNKRQIEKRKIVVLEEEKEVDRKSWNQNQSRIRRRKYNKKNSRII